MDTLFTICSLIPFYLIGAIPSGRILAYKRGIKLDDHGSGNVGATNVARVLGKNAGIITLIADIGKGLLATLISFVVVGTLSHAALAGFAAVGGHCFSIPGKMKGGKGVATALGVYLGISATTAAGGLVVFGLVMAITRIVSLSSICAALTMPIFAFFLIITESVVFPLAGISFIVVFRHKENIVRLIEGREKKFSSGSSSKVTATPKG
jgi:glycerol-3-phosphate acyltransferase PlsY